MGLKPDHWIRKMALEQRMIEPFVDDQVRNGVISYGLSSYGYDIRVADEFRIFTPGLGDLTVVDPKNFDTRAMVGFTGEVCVIPPNSFALGRSVEYFRVPRDVLCVCLGKSTYARCFRGDTRVALVDGTAPTLEEMARQAEDGELFWGYSMGRFGRIIVTLLEAPRYIGRDALMQIKLDNGETINCTPDHRFLLRDGTSAEAKDLRPGNSLMPLYRQLVRGYESVYQPLNGHLHPTHRLADEWNLRHDIYENEPGTHRHHLDLDKRNNNPWNLTRMPADEHVALHNELFYGDDFDPDEHSAAIRAALDKLKQDAEWREHYSQVQSERATAFWSDDLYKEVRHRVLEMRRNQSDETRQKRSDSLKEYYSDPANRERHSRIMKKAWEGDQERRAKQAEIARSIRLREDITSERVREALNQAGSLRGAARLLDCDRSVFRRFPDVIAEFRDSEHIRTHDSKNHRVIEIQDLPGEHDVFCCTVPEAGNFALQSGVFVHNCGIIVNITPFEPAWEGRVTLEISNTTPLPAKIYANEGIAQVLFFEGDEECEVSYADKKGKYQNQRSIVLPRL
ncbi:dCTP deaminase [candidate division KSB3 bacterium]|nr:dCTP deaminase [candidate division KSB3 bacterium]